MQNNIIVRRADGSLFHFFYLGNSGLCCRRLPCNTNQYDIILPDSYHDFDVGSDRENNIYVACQDGEGNIIYLVYSNERWSKFVMLESRVKMPYPKHFKLYCTDIVHIFYTINAEDKSMLVHHTPNIASVPAVIDYVSSEKQDFSVCPGASGITLFYSASGGKLKSRSVDGNAQAAVPFNLSGVENAFVLSERGNTHIAYCTKANGDYAVYCNQKLICPSLPKPVRPFLSFENNKLYIFWERDTRPFMYRSDSGGRFWDRVSFSEFGANRYSNFRTIKLVEPSGAFLYTLGFIEKSIISLVLHRGFLISEKKEPDEKALQVLEMERLKARVSLLEQSLSRQRAVSPVNQHLADEIEILKDEIKKLKNDVADIRLKSKSLS